MNPEKTLIWILRFGAGFLFLATLAIVLPVAWMAETHEWLGLGTFPDSPIVGYLTRSLSALYVYHGAMVWILATDVRRYLPIIRLIGFGDILFGLTMLAIDSYVGMPWFWTLGEGPSLILFGAIILHFAYRMPR